MDSQQFSDSRPPRRQKPSGRALALSLFCSLFVMASAILPSAAGASFEETFAQAGSGAGQLDPIGIAASQANGRLYVADSSNDRVSVFDQSGTFLFAFGWGVRDGTSQLQTCGPQATPSSATCQAGISGPGVGQFRGPAHLAVDNHPSSPSYGDIYVYDNSNFRVDKFDSSGTFLFAFGWGVRDGASELQTCGPQATPPAATCQIGISGVGAGQFASRSSEDISSGGEFASSNYPHWGAQPIAVDPSGLVWVGQRERIERFNADGSFASEVALPGQHIDSLVIAASGDFYTDFEGGEEHTFVCEGPTCLPVQRQIPGEIVKYSSAGTKLATIAADLGPAPLHNALALDSSGNLFVVDRSEDLDSAEQVCVQQGANGCVWQPALGETGAGILEFNSTGEKVKQWDVHTSNSLLTIPLLANAVGLAFDQATGSLYATRNNGSPTGIRISVPPPGPLPREGGESASALSTIATLHATVNPEGKPTTYHFQYVDQAHFEMGGFSNPATEETAESSSIGADFGEYPVVGQLESLEPETTYHYRVVAHNSEGTVPGEDETFATKPAASFDILPIAEPGQTSATLTDLVNPNGLTTHVHLAYGIASTAEHVTAIQTIEGTEYAKVTATLESLQPATTYHVRAVAENAAGTLEGPEETFTTAGASCPNEALREENHSTALPDCRAYEQVSPVDKGGISPLGGLDFTPDGEAAAFETTVPLPEAPSGLVGNYVARRSSQTGWHDESISPPAQARAIEGITDWPYAMDFSSDLSRTLFQSAYPFDPQAQGAFEHGQPTQLYLRAADGSLTWLSHRAALPETGSSNNVFEGGSADLSHVFFGSANQLTPETRGSEAENLYEWSEAGGLHAVNLAPGTNALLPGGAQIGSSGQESGDYLVPHVGSPYEPSAVSADGSAAFFTDPLRGTPQLYVRHDGETDEVSLSQLSGSVGQPAARGASFLVASPDGSKVDFYSGSQLTDDAAAKGGIYQYAISSKQLTFLVPAAGPSLIGATPSLSAVSFVQFGSGGGGLEVGLMRQGHPLATIATGIASTTTAMRGGIAYENGHGGGLIAAAQASISPDGRYLAFAAMGNPTAYNAEGHFEIYLYDADTGKTACVSCRPNGTSANGEAALFPAKFDLVASSAPTASPTPAPSSSAPPNSFSLLMKTRPRTPTSTRVASSACSPPARAPPPRRSPAPPQTAATSSSSPTRA